MCGEVLNPKGIPQQSPGLRGTSYPGGTPKTNTTLKGLRHHATTADSRKQDGARASITERGLSSPQQRLNLPRLRRMLRPTFFYVAADWKVRAPFLNPTYYVTGKRKSAATP